MSKNKEEVELRAIDEEAEEKNSRLVRLNEDSVEEVVEEEPVRIGGSDARDEGAEGVGREEMKIRSSEPDVSKLIEGSDEVLDQGLEENWESGTGNERKIPKGWIWVVVLLFLAALTWSVVKVVASKEKQVAIEKETELILEKEIEEERDAEKLVETIEETVRDFYDSRTVGEMVKYVRHPERVRPLMEDYYSRNPLEAKRMKSLLSMRAIDLSDSGDFWMVRVEFGSSAGGEQEIVMVEVNGPDRVRVDWETVVCYQPMDWAEFATDRPGGSTGNFRVYAERDHHYSHEFADSEKYACYMLTTRDSEMPLFGYVSRASEDFKLIEANLGPDPEQTRSLILKLHRPENMASKYGVIIQEMVSPLWLYAQSPEAEKK